MSTLATVRARIADDINRSDLNTQIDLAINRAIKYYSNKERFWFDETTGTFSTIASQESYGTSDNLPSDIAEIDTVRIALSSTNNPGLIPRAYQWMQDANSSNATGTPSDYAWYQGEMYFYLIPNSVWTITISYRKTYSDLSGDSSTNNYTVYAEELIEPRARAWIYARILKDPDNAQIARIEEAEALAVLQKRSSDMLSIGYVTPNGF